MFPKGHLQEVLVHRFSGNCLQYFLHWALQLRMVRQHTPHRFACGMAYTTTASGKVCPLCLFNGVMDEGFWESSLSQPCDDLSTRRVPTTSTGGQCQNSVDKRARSRPRTGRNRSECVRDADSLEHQEAVVDGKKKHIQYLSVDLHYGVGRGFGGH